MKLFQHLRGGLVAAALISVCSQPAYSASINLAEALERTLKENPELELYPLAQRQAEALRLQAGIRPSPELSLELENAFGSGEFSGTDSAEVTLALSQTIELGGKRDRGKILLPFNDGHRLPKLRRRPIQRNEQRTCWRCGRHGLYASWGHLRKLLPMLNWNAP